MFHVEQGAEKKFQIKLNFSEYKNFLEDFLRHIKKLFHMELFLFFRTM